MSYFLDELDLDNLKEGDILYNKTHSIWHFSPTYTYSPIKRITPKGKIRLESGTLIDPQCTHLRKLTTEVLIEENNWDIKQILKDMLTAIECGTNKVIQNIQVDEAISIINMLMPYIEQLQQYKEYNNSLANSLSSRIPLNYDKVLEKRTKLINQLLDEKEKANETV